MTSKRIRVGVMDPDDVGQESFTKKELFWRPSGPSCDWASAGPQSLELWRQLLVRHSFRRESLWFIESRASWLYEMILVDSLRVAKRSVYTLWSMRLR